MPSTDVRLTDRDIRQSRFFGVPLGLDAEFFPAIIAAAKRCDDDAILEALHGPDNQHSLLRSLSRNSGAHAFIVNYVLPKRHGVITSPIRNVVFELLQDPSMWDIRYLYAGEEATPFFASSFHSDDSTKNAPGRLRLTCSPQISSLTKEGIYEFGTRYDSSVPVAVKLSNGKSYDRRREFLPGTAVLWESCSGVHSSPDFGQEQRDQWDSPRQFLSITFDFDRLMRLANEIVQKRMVGEVEPHQRTLGARARLLMDHDL